MGIIAVVQLLPGVVLAPFAAYAGDRFSPRNAVAISYGLQSAAMAATAIAMVAGAPLGAYVAGAIVATCFTFTRPAMGSLLPSVTHAPGDLVAANVLTGSIQQVGVFVGPLVAGALMAVSSPAAVFAVGAAATAFACFAVMGIDPIDPFARVVDLDARAVVADAFRGFSTLRHEGHLRVLVLLGATAGIIRGIGDVIFVTFSEDRLSGGGGQAGLLAAAYGLGAIAGALSVSRLVRTNRVGGQFVVSGCLAGAGLLALSWIDMFPPALPAFALLGAGETLLQLTSTVTIQRQAPPEVLARVFGILEGTTMAAIAFGSLAVTVLVAWTTIGTSFVVLALLLTLTVLAAVARLRRFRDDRPVVDDELVQRLLADPIFAPLPAPTIERLARGIEPVDVTAGQVVIAEGEFGDRYYMASNGSLQVTIGGQIVGSLEGGDGFGEIALLRDVPRAATVTAQTPMSLLAVSRDDFLEAVTGHVRSLGAATAAADRFLGPRES